MNNTTFPVFDLPDWTDLYKKSYLPINSPVKSEELMKPKEPEEPEKNHLLITDRLEQLWWESYLHVIDAVDFDDNKQTWFIRITPKIRKWMYLQRNKYRNNQLSPDRIKALEVIPTWSWICRRYHCQTVKFTQVQWVIMYFKVHNYISRKKKWPLRGLLYNWINYNNTNYDNLNIPQLRMLYNLNNYGPYPIFKQV